MLPFLKHHHQTFSKHHNHSGKQRRQLKISPFKEPRKEIAPVKDFLVNLGIRMKTDQKKTNADLSTLKKLVIDLYNEVIFKWPRAADCAEVDKIVYLLRQLHWLVVTHPGSDFL